MDGTIHVPKPGGLPYTIGVDAWEVGFAFEGCSSDPSVRDRQRRVLQQFLDELGSACYLWHVAPEIRSTHVDHEVATVGLKDFGRTYGVNIGCQWAVYGVMSGAEPPAKYFVPEGERLPPFFRQGDE